MTAIILPGRKIRRDFKPDFPVRLRHDYPLVRYLSAAWLSKAPNPVDLVTGQFGWTKTGTIDSSVSKFGRAIKGDGTSGYISRSIDVSNFRPHLMLAVFEAAVVSATPKTIYSLGSALSGSSAYIRISNGSDTTTPIMAQIRSVDNSTNAHVATGPVPTVGELYACAWYVSSTSSADSTLWVNGTSYTATGGTLETFGSGTFVHETIGALKRGSVIHYSPDHILLVARGIPPLGTDLDAVLRDWTHNPWELLEPLARRAFVMLGSGDVTVDADAQFHIDWRASLATDAAMPTEALAAARTDHAPAIDWLALIRGDRSAPVGWRSALDADQSAQSDWTSAINTDQAIQADNLAMLDRPAIVQASWLSGARADRSISADWLAATRQDAAIPMEWSGALLITADAALPAEWRQAVSIDAALSADALALIQADQAAPIENLATIRAEAQSVIESLARIARDAALPLEWPGGLLITADAPMPIEWRQALAADAAIPADRAQIIVTDQPIPAEFKAGVISDQGSVLDWLASIRSDAAMPTEWKSAAVIQADAAIPVEWGGVAAFVAGNISVFHIDARGTVWRIPARGIIWRG